MSEVPVKVSVWALIWVIEILFVSLFPFLSVANIIKYPCLLFIVRDINVVHPSLKKLIVQ